MRYTTHQAKTHLSRLLEEASTGVEVVIAKGKRSVARLVPHSEKKKASRPKVGEITSKPFTKVVKPETTDNVKDTPLYI